MANCSILAWKMSWPEEPGGLQSMWSQGVRHYWAQIHTHTHTQSKEETIEELTKIEFDDLCKKSVKYNFKAWVGDNSVPLDSRVSSVAETACFLFNTNSFHFSGGLVLETEINTLLPSQQIESVLYCLSQVRDRNKMWAAIKLLLIPLHFS